MQSCHAAVEAGRHLLPDEIEHPHLIVCALPDEAALCRCLDWLTRQGLCFRAFREPDRGNELTALCAGPVSGSDRRRFRRFRCLTGPGFL